MNLNELEAQNSAIIQQINRTEVFECGMCPSGLGTVWEMLDFKARPFVDAVSQIADLDAVLQGVFPPSARLNDDVNDRIEKRLLSLIALCSVLSLKVTGRSAHGLKADLRSMRNAAEVRAAVLHLRKTFVYELDETRFLWLDQGDRVLFTKTADEVLGEIAVASFPSLVDDIEEAGKCIALERGTAAVFHMMRAGEVAVEGLWRSVPGNAKKPRPNGGWGATSREIDDAMKESGALATSPCWKKRKQFYEDVHAYFQAVKRAWRNPTMHMERG